MHTKTQRRQVRLGTKLGTEVETVILSSDVRASDNKTDFCIPERNYTRIRRQSEGNGLLWLIRLIVYFVVLSGSSPAHAGANLAPDDLDTKAGFTARLLYDPPYMPFIVVWLRIDGQEPLPFIVDTGVSSALLVDRRAAKKLHLEPNRVDGVANGNVKVTGAGVNSVALCGQNPGEILDLHLLSVFVLDLRQLDDMYSGPPIAGIIGAPLLADWTVQLDFVQQTMTLFMERNTRLQLPGATTLPLTRREGKYYITVSPEPNITTSVELDTGSLTSSLPVSLAEYLHPAATRLAVSEGLGRSVIGDQWRLTNFKIGDLQEPEIAASSATSNEVSLLGMDVLARFRITLDFRNSQVSLQRATNYNLRAHLCGWTGIVLDRDRNCKVGSVIAGSPAWSAGVKKGDLLVSIDGHSTTVLSPGVVQHLLDGYAGSEARLDLRHDRNVRIVTFVRANQFEAPRGALAGLTMSRSDGEPLAVLRVDPGSAPERAGIMADDVVVALNGAPTEKMTQQEIWNQVQKPLIVLTVVRRGIPQPRSFRLTDSGLENRSIDAAHRSVH